MKHSCINKNNYMDIKLTSNNSESSLISPFHSYTDVICGIILTQAANLFFTSPLLKNQ